MMGQTLSEPNTVKESACCQNTQFKVGSSCMQGWRVTMEDAHTHILSLPDDPDAAFFGVYDGHGSGKISEYAGKNLHKFITNRKEYREGDIAEALKQGFIEMDDAMANEDSLRKETCGSTAVTVLIKDNRIYCANAGDSRAIASIKGKALDLSDDHKPINAGEYKRIIAAGGYVDYNRINGNLALSRAFGDYVFKNNKRKNHDEQIVIACPEISTYELNDDWEFVVLACDGIWDMLTSQQVVDHVRDEIAKGLEPEEICESLMTRCLAPDLQMGGLGCDNMTVILVALVNGRSYDDLKNKCAAPKMDANSETMEDLYSCQ